MADWLVQRDDEGAVDGLAAALAAYMLRHAQRADHDLGEETSKVLRSLLDRVCRCEGTLARVELEWDADQPCLTVMGAPTGRRRPDHAASCEVRAQAVLSARRPHGRSFVLEPVEPDALPAPEDFGADGWVGREPFLRALVVQASSRVEQRFGPDAIDSVITQVGADVGNRMEDEYRRARGTVERLSPEHMGELFVGLKRAIDGDFYVIEADDDQIVLGNRRCPFGEAVRRSPSLCRMTSSVFGGIAARNVGFAAVCLDERIAVGDDECRVRVLLRPDGVLPSHAHRYGTPSGRLRIAVAAPAGLVRDPMSEALSHHDVDVAPVQEDPQGALATLAGHPPFDLLLVDLPERDTGRAVDLALAARERDPEVGVVVVCEEPDPLAARRLLAAGGGVGHLLKDAVGDMPSFVSSLRAVADGGTVVSPAITDAVAAADEDQLAELTLRELEVLGLVAEGYSNQAVADQLCVSKRAVEKHLGNVFRKLGLGDGSRDRRVQASLLYQRARRS
jgi:DNA-binding NarL/FixJ family response regulator